MAFYQSDDHDDDDDDDLEEEDDAIIVYGERTPAVTLLRDDEPGFGDNAFSQTQHTTTSNASPSLQQRRTQQQQQQRQPLVPRHERVRRRKLQEWQHQQALLDPHSSSQSSTSQGERSAASSDNPFAALEAALENEQEVDGEKEEDSQSEKGRIASNNEQPPMHSPREALLHVDSDSPPPPPPPPARQSPSSGESYHDDSPRCKDSSNAVSTKENDWPQQEQNASSTAPPSSFSATASPRRASSHPEQQRAGGNMHPSLQPTLSESRESAPRSTQPSSRQQLSPPEPSQHSFSASGMHANNSQSQWRVSNRRTQIQCASLPSYTEQRQQQNHAASLLARSRRMEQKRQQHQHQQQRGSQNNGTREEGMIRKRPAAVKPTAASIVGTRPSHWGGGKSSSLQRPPSFLGRVNDDAALRKKRSRLAKAASTSSSLLLGASLSQRVQPPPSQPARQQRAGNNKGEAFSAVANGNDVATSNLLTSSPGKSTTTFAPLFLQQSSPADKVVESSKDDNDHVINPLFDNDHDGTPYPFRSPVAIRTIKRPRASGGASNSAGSLVKRYRSLRSSQTSNGLRLLQQQNRAGDGGSGSGSNAMLSRGHQDWAKSLTDITVLQDVGGTGIGPPKTNPSANAAEGLPSSTPSRAPSTQSASTGRKQQHAPRSPPRKQHGSSASNNALFWTVPVYLHRHQVLYQSNQASTTTGTALQKVHALCTFLPPPESALPQEQETVSRGKKLRLYNAIVFDLKQTTAAVTGFLPLPLEAVRVMGICWMIVATQLHENYPQQRLRLPALPNLSELPPQQQRQDEEEQQDATEQGQSAMQGRNAILAAIEAL